jgi:hypothetical protein
VNAELLADLAAYGADASSLPERMLKPAEYEIWPEHEDAVLTFLRCQTQWRTTMTGVMGLDYGVVLQVMELYAVGNKRQVLEDLQVMEAHARDLFHREGEQQAKEAASRKPARGRR